MTKLDTEDKYVKVVHAVTQSLWHVILEIREGTLGPASATPIVEILMDVLKSGKRQGFTLPEVDQWWCREVLESYERLD